MTKINFKISMIALVVGMFALTSCGGESKKQSTAETPETKTEAKADGVSAIPKDKITAVSWQSESEKQAAIAEIPQELLKSVGTLKNCMVLKCSDDGYKYKLVINIDSKGNAEANLEKLVNYYKSIGGKVEKSTNVLSDYEITFDYAVSRDISATENYIKVNFDVIKQ
jgi:hypothetical protein